MSCHSFEVVSWRQELHNSVDSFVSVSRPAHWWLLFAIISEAVLITDAGVLAEGCFWFKKNKCQEREMLTHWHNKKLESFQEIVFERSCLQCRPTRLTDIIAENRNTPLPQNSSHWWVRLSQLFFIFWMHTCAAKLHFEITKWAQEVLLSSWKQSFFCNWQSCSTRLGEGGVALTWEPHTKKPNIQTWKLADFCAELNHTKATSARQETNGVQIQTHERWGPFYCKEAATF